MHRQPAGQIATSGHPCLGVLSHTLLWLHELPMLRHDWHVLHVLRGSVTMRHVWRRPLPAMRGRCRPRHHHLRPHLLRPVHGLHCLPVHMAWHLALLPGPAVGLHEGGGDALLLRVLALLLLGLGLRRRHAIPDLLLSCSDADGERLLELEQRDEGDEQRFAVVAHNLHMRRAQEGRR